MDHFRSKKAKNNIKSLFLAFLYFLYLLRYREELLPGTTKAVSFRHEILDFTPLNNA